MEKSWIGPDDTLTIGQVGFLVLRSHDLDGWARFCLSDTPAHTNLSHQPRIRGWCGSFNNVSTYARGVVRVERVARNGRAMVCELEGAELASALEDLGYAELAG